jgi:hypothetical protein
LDESEKDKETPTPKPPIVDEDAEVVWLRRGERGHGLPT